MVKATPMSIIRNALGPILTLSELIEAYNKETDETMKSKTMRMILSLGETAHNGVDKIVKQVEVLEQEGKVLRRGTVVLATFGHNTVLNKPFRFLYEFGYYTKDACVAFPKGESSMQDAKLFELSEITIPTEEELDDAIWG